MNTTGERDSMSASPRSDGETPEAVAGAADVAAASRAYGVDTSVFEPAIAAPRVVALTRGRRWGANCQERREARTRRHRLDDSTRAPSWALKRALARPRVPAPAGMGSRLAGIVVAAGLGAWGAYLLGPEALRQWKEWRAQRAVEEKLQAPAELPPAPPALPTHDPAIGRLGTDSSVSPEPLALVLVATQPGRNAFEGTAQLGVDVRNPQTYGAGALLENGARLAEIHGDAVVLERGRQRYRLRVRENVAEVERTQLPPGQSSFESPAQTAEREARRALVMVGGAAAAGGLHAATPTTSFDHFADVARAYAEMHEGRVTALVVGQGTTASGLNRLGLRHGDRITAVDGQPVSSEAQWHGVMNSLSAGNAVRVQVQRGESVVEVTLKPEALQPPEPPSAMPGPGALPPGVG